MTMTVSVAVPWSSHRTTMVHGVRCTTTYHCTLPRATVFKLMKIFLFLVWLVSSWTTIPTTGLSISATTRQLRRRSSDNVSIRSWAARSVIGGEGDNGGSSSSSSSSSSLLSSSAAAGARTMHPSNVTEKITSTINSMADDCDHNDNSNRNKANQAGVSSATKEMSKTSSSSSSSRRRSYTTRLSEERRIIEEHLREAQIVLRRIRDDNAAGMGDDDPPERTDIEPNPVWTQEYCDSMLAACLSHDEWDHVLDVLNIMERHNVTQVHSTYHSCIRACYVMRKLQNAYDVYKAMIDADIPVLAEDVEYLIKAFCSSTTTAAAASSSSSSSTKQDWLKHALSILHRYASTSTKNSGDHDETDHDSDKAEPLSLAVYDMVLQALQERNQWMESVRLIRSMDNQHERHAQPGLSSYKIVIACCTKSQQCDLAEQMLQSCISKDLVPSTEMFEQVMISLGRQGKWRRSMQLFERMMTLIKESRNRHPDDFVDIPSPTNVMYNAMINACTKAREVSVAKNLLMQMRKNGLRPDIISFNAVITACASAGRWKDASKVLDQLNREPGVNPDIYTYTNAIRAFGKGGKTDRALSLFQVVKDKKLPLDAYCYAAAIEACSKSKGMHVKALELLEEMEELGIAPTEIIYSVTMTACGNGGQIEKALELLDVMRQKKMKVNRITYNSAITAISRAAKLHGKKKSSEEKDDIDGSNWEKVRALFRAMEEDGIEPDGFTYVAAISCCGSEGRWQEALRLIETMENGGPATLPNKIAYSAAISCCGKAGQVDQALRLFRKMKGQGLKPDRICYNSLFAALRNAKRPKTAVDLWDEMLGRCVEDASGKASTIKSSEMIVPDILTVSEAIGAMSWVRDGAETETSKHKIGLVFADALSLGVFKDPLGSMFDVDLVGMTFPVARAAVAHVMNRILMASHTEEDLQTLVFITGVGAATLSKRSRVGRETGKEDNSGNDRSQSTLRGYVQEILRIDYSPPLESSVPKLAQGTVEVSQESLGKWLRHQKR